MAMPEKIGPSTTKILPFDRPLMSSKDEPPKPTFWQQYGTAAQIASAICAIALLPVTITLGFLTIYWHVTANKTTDDQAAMTRIADAEIGKKAQENAGQLNDRIGAVMDPKLEGINAKLDILTKLVMDHEGQLKRMQEVNKRNSQAEELAESRDPAQALEGIKQVVEYAEDQNRLVQQARLDTFRNTIQRTANSTQNYWTAAAALINYQSFLNQAAGRVPDPRTVAHSCGGLTEGRGGYNMIQGNIPIVGCIIDLDKTHNNFDGAVFANSVVRYYGGPVAAKNITFFNCRFIVELPPTSGTPQRANFLLALLQSPNQAKVFLPPPA